ncbi:MAG TPA: TlpA disulfide reductase family protein [Tepidisphaeraceae bacterium]
MLAAWTVLLLVSSWTPNARAAELPRYNLPVGAQIVYSIHMENLVGERSYAYDGRWEFTVLKDNPDGSKHIAAIKALATTYSVNGEARSSPEQISRGHFDMKPDGTMKMNPSLLPGFNPQIIFPRLPNTADELSKGWSGLFERSGVTTTFKTQPAEGNEIAFVGEETGAYHTINQRTDKWIYHFDPAKGLVTKIDAENGQTYGSEQKGSAAIALEKEEQLPEADVKSMVEEHDAFVKAFEKADDLLRRASAGAKDSDELVSQAQQTLTEAAGNANSDAVKADFTDAITRAQVAARTVQAMQQRIEPLKGQAAPDFTLPDVGGHAHKLADQQGKVVVLEFFKRSSNQAAYTIPDVQKAAEKHKDKVAIFGMTDDADEADTKLVIDALAIKYPVLKLEGPATEFGVQAFPSTVILDQKGNVQYLFQGYSKSRGQDVEEKIEELLKAAP